MSWENLHGVSVRQRPAGSHIQGMLLAEIAVKKMEHPEVQRELPLG